MSARVLLTGVGATPDPQTGADVPNSPVDDVYGREQRLIELHLVPLSTAGQRDLSDTLWGC